MEWSSVLNTLVLTAAALLCMIGIALSSLSLSGTWLVLMATGLISWVRWPDPPGWITLTAFFALCTLTELLEAVAGIWGIHKRGGSKATSVAALFGGLIGIGVGGFIPIPILGSLICMLIGSFFLAFWVEYRRLEQKDKATHIAFGAVIGRVSIILLKTAITLTMTFTLLIQLFFT